MWKHKLGLLNRRRGRQWPSAWLWKLCGPSFAALVITQLLATLQTTQQQLGRGPDTNWHVGIVSEVSVIFNLRTASSTLHFWRIESVVSTILQFTTNVGVRGKGEIGWNNEWSIYLKLSSAKLNLRALEEGCWQRAGCTSPFPSGACTRCQSGEE